MGLEEKIEITYQISNAMQLEEIESMVSFSCKKRLKNHFTLLIATNN